MIEDRQPPDKQPKKTEINLTEDPKLDALVLEESKGKMYA